MARAPRAVRGLPRAAAASRCWPSATASWSATRWWRSRRSSETLLPDTWETGERVAEIESLSVAPAARGAGIGSALLDRIDAELEAEGVRDVLIGALVTNAGAIRLYERRGFRPAWLYMFRLGGRSA